MEIITNIFLGLLGIIIYTLLKLWAHLNKKKGQQFNPYILVQDNLLSWIIAALIVVTTTLAIHLVPGTAELVKVWLPGYEMQNSPVGFLGLGLFLGFSCKTVIKAYK